MASRWRFSLENFPSVKDAWYRLFLFAHGLGFRRPWTCRMVDGWSMDGRDRILIVEKRTNCQIVTTHRLVHDI